MKNRWSRVVRPRLSLWRGSLKRTISGGGPTSLYVSGVITFSYGLHMAWHPAGVMFLGGAMVHWALKIDGAAR